MFVFVILAATIALASVNGSIFNKTDGVENENLRASKCRGDTAEYTVVADIHCLCGGGEGDEPNILAYAKYAEKPKGQKIYYKDFKVIGKEGGKDRQANNFADFSNLGKIKCKEDKEQELYLSIYDYDQISESDYLGYTKPVAIFKHGKFFPNLEVLTTKDSEIVQCKSAGCYDKKADVVLQVTKQ